MGLLWTFMGHSPVYQAFAGSVEVLGGLLLLWRRTTTLGALVCVGAMANVVMLNFGYDVPVKLFSSHLLLVAMVLAGLDAPRLWGVLVQGRAVPAREVPPVLDGRRGRRVRLGIKGLYVGGVLVLMIVGSLQMYYEYGPGAPRPPLYGVYEVASHELDGNERPVLASDERPWRHVAFTRYGGLVMWPVHGDSRMYRAQVDLDAGTIELSIPGPEAPPQTLRFHRVEGGPDEGALVIEGAIDGVQHRVTLRHVDESQIRLTARGFHWVSEQPFNR